MQMQQRDTVGEVSYQPTSPKVLDLESMCICPAKSLSFWNENWRIVEIAWLHLYLLVWSLLWNIQGCACPSSQPWVIKDKKQHLVGPPLVEGCRSTDDYWEGNRTEPQFGANLLVLFPKNGCHQKIRRVVEFCCIPHIFQSIFHVGC